MDYEDSGARFEREIQELYGRSDAPLPAPSGTEEAPCFSPS